MSLGRAEMRKLEGERDVSVKQGVKTFERCTPWLNCSPVCALATDEEDTRHGYCMSDDTVSSAFQRVRMCTHICVCCYSPKNSDKSVAAPRKLAKSTTLMPVSAGTGKWHIRLGRVSESSCRASNISTYSITG